MDVVVVGDVEGLGGVEGGAGLASNVGEAKASAVGACVEGGERVGVVCALDAGLTLLAAPRGTRVALVNVSQARSVTNQPDGTALLTFGDWLRHDIAFYDPALPARGSTSVRGAFPEPRFSVESPAWAPDGRHLGYVMKVWENSSDSEPKAAGIVAVDTDRPSKAPVIVACGDAPSWGPPAR